VESLQRIARKVAGFFVAYDILLTPTLAEPPVSLKTFAVTAEDPLAVIDRAWNFAPFTALANATGQPAMSVPLFWNDTGLPIGSHFLGRFGEEGKLFRLASQLEAEKPWAKKTPPSF
jgi:amidase